MNKENLATYLNDHLAGSVMALELMQHLASEHAESSLERVLAGLHADVEADRRELQDVMARLDISESGTRKATAWLAEKAAQLKLLVDDQGGGALRLFESLEALSLGLEGKRSLWRALRAASEELPELTGIDYTRLVQRSEEQRSRIEGARLEAAKAAFGEAN
ncbi:MAG TPA: hypothetical protein VFU22_30750 [Roseiflexaceae bacterium]|nr:hypothetical protein [Roseiflexaceae bacterium]